MLTPHQQECFDKIILDIDTIVQSGGQWDNVVSLIGAAGVGKTFMTVQIIKQLISMNYRVIMTTPTHKALKVAKDMMDTQGINIACSTIHSFLNLKLKPNFENGLQELISEEFSKNKVRTDVLVVDESSMVSAELFEHIETAIRYRRAKCVLFVGDYFQLPPVDGDVNPVFNMKSQYQLKEIVRQAKDNPIISLATDIRRRIETKQFIPLLDVVVPHLCDTITITSDGNAFMRDYFGYDETNWYDKDQVIAAYTNATVDKYNKAVRKKYWTEKGISEIEYLKEGDTIIFQEAHIENDTVIHANNDIVQVTKAQKLMDEDNYCWYWDCEDDTGSRFKVIDPISTQKYNTFLESIAKSAGRAEKLEKKVLWQRYYEEKTKYQNVKYAFASTIHKLQGSTFKTAYIDMRELNKFFGFQDAEFIYRLLYVAVTRASQNISILI
jgi:exodeoxyribonuclease-5